MQHALLRLFSITLGSVILTFLAVFMVRWIGSHQTFQAPPHTWFKEEFWWVFNGDTEKLCANSDPSTLVPEPKWIIKVPVKRYDEGWQVPCATPVPIEKFLSASSHREWMLDVPSIDTWDLDKLVASLEPLDKEHRFAVMTHSQKAAKFLRGKAPQWIFSADSASILRLVVFQNLWIETSMDFWPDFVVTSGDKKDTSRLSARNADELLRRKKRIVWNWDAKNSETPSIPIQGVMTSRPAEAVEKFKLTRP